MYSLEKIPRSFWPTNNIDPGSYEEPPPKVLRHFPAAARPSASLAALLAALRAAANSERPVARRKP